MSLPSHMGPLHSQLYYPTRIRSAKACDNCRMKRIKCSGASPDTSSSCLACISYNKPCVFSQTADPRARRGKRKDSSADAGDGAILDQQPQKHGASSDADASAGSVSGARRSKQHTSVARSASSRAAGASHALHRASASPSMSSTAGSGDDYHNLSPESSISSHAGPSLPEFQPGGVEPSMDIRSSLDATAAGRKFYRLYVPMMIGAPEYNTRASNPHDAIHDPQTLSILAAHDLFNAMVRTYFECIDPMCPLFESPSVMRDEIAYFVADLQNRAAAASGSQEPQLFLRAKMVLCIGALALRDKLNGPQTEAMQLLALHTFKETLFDQVIDYCCSVILEQSITSLQIMMLISLYSKHQQQTTKALYWCRMALRMAQLFRFRHHNNSLELTLVNYCLFIMESQICLLDNLDDPRCREGDLPLPDRAIQLRYPIFCMRISLARMMNRYTIFLRNLMQGEKHMATNLATVCCDLIAFKDFMPLNLQVEPSLSGHFGSDPKASMFIASTAFHLEYYGAVIVIMAMLSGLGFVLNSSNFKLRNHATIHVSAARKLIHHLYTLRHSLSYAACWVDPKQVLKAFVIIHAFRHSRGANLDFANADDEQLLQFSAILFGEMMLPTERNRLVRSLMEELRVAVDLNAQAVDSQVSAALDPAQGELSSFFENSAYITSPHTDALGVFSYPFQ